MNSLHTQERGASLLEILVSLIILAIGLLGLAALQTVGAKSGFSAYHRSQATWLAYDMSDRMRTNRTAALANNYNTAMPSTPPACSANLPTAGTLASRDVAEWRNQVACLLPSGNASVARDTADPTVFIIRIQWDDVRGDIQPTTATSIETFEFRTAI